MRRFLPLWRVVRIAIPTCYLFASASYANQLANSERLSWPCFRGDTRNTGQSHWKKPPKASVWMYETLPSAGKTAKISASPALGIDGTLYIGTDRLYALDAATGNKNWQFYTQDVFNGSPAVSADGWLYVGCMDGVCYALDASNGKVHWQFKTGAHILSSPALSSDGTVYIGSGDNTFYALKARTGELVWKAPLQHDVASSPVIGNKGLVYIQNWGTLYAVQHTDGKQAWTYQAPDDLFSNGVPALDSEGNLYAAFVLKGPTRNGTASVVSLNSQTGKLRWETHLPLYVFASPAVGTNGLIYIGCGDGKLYALDQKTGKTRWTFTTGEQIQASPAIGADGTVYVGSYDKKLYAVNGETGAKKWEFATKGGIQSSPVVSHDGTVFVGSLDGNVYAVRSDAKPALPIAPLPDKQNAEE